MQSQNGSNSTSDRANPTPSISSLGRNHRIAAQTKFNGTAISRCLPAGAQTFQVGPNNGDTPTVTTATVSHRGRRPTTPPRPPRRHWAAIDTTLDTITTNRATYGAAISRSNMAIQNLQITGENQSAARGRIMDADFAAETANLSRAQIPQQAGTAMVAQANQMPRGFCNR